MFPKIIWILWLQGWESAPPIVQACIKTWQVQNPGWVIHTLDTKTLSNYLDPATLVPFTTKSLPPEALSDVIRILLLERYGGVWVDSTVYCLQPLDSWLPERVTSGFFAFANPGPDLLLSSWFLAAAKGNYLVQEWHRLVFNYWAQHKEPDQYFWFHQLFAEACAADSFFREAWQATPTLSAVPPHHYLPYEKLALPLSPYDRTFLDTPSTPVLKLTHKLPQVMYPPDSVLRHLQDRAEALAATQPNLQPSAPRTLLVAWYGSFAGHGTIGDLLALQSVVSHLVGLGHRVYHASAQDLNIEGSQRVSWQDVPPSAFDAFLFVCGPILKQHPQIQALFKKFEHLSKFGVGVSLFPPDHFNYINPFDKVLAREGQPEQFEDVAILSPTRHTRPTQVPGQPFTIGLVLRGPQSEYGPDLCLWEQTEQLVLEAANQLLQQRPGRLIRIENHLQQSGLSPTELEAQYAACDLIFTSRFHGAMLALRHHIPFIAIDQIQGGAKVRELVGGTFWPYVYAVDQVNVAHLVADARYLLSGHLNSLLFSTRTRVISRANLTLLHLTDLIQTLS